MIPHTHVSVNVQCLTYHLIVSATPPHHGLNWTELRRDCSILNCMFVLDWIGISQHCQAPVWEDQKLHRDCSILNCMFVLDWITLLDIATDWIGFEGRSKSNSRSWSWWRLAVGVRFLSIPNIASLLCEENKSHRKVHLNNNLYSF